MPYAIIRTGGHQEKVTPGEQITVDRMKQEVGEEVTFAPLMLSKSETEVISDRRALEEGSAVVVGKVLQHLKGDKIDIFQYRNKTGYRRHTGHRQPLTLVEIAEIRFGGETFTAPAPVEEPAPEELAAQAEAAPTAKTPTTEKKPPAPKRAAPKKKALAKKK